MAAALEVLEPPLPRLPDAEAMPTDAPAELELAVTLHLGSSTLELARVRAADVVALAEFEASPTLGAATELIAALRGRGARLSRCSGAAGKPQPERQGGGHRALRQKRNSTLERVLARLREGPASSGELVAAGICRHAAHVRGCVQYLRAKKGCDIRLIDGAYALVAEGQKEKS